MFKYYFKYLILLAAAVSVLACSHNNKPVIKFSGDRTSIIIKNIDETSLLQAKNQTQLKENAVSLVNVFLRPRELDSLQDEIEVAGKVNVVGDSVVFVPLKPFLHGRSYLIENYIGIKFAGLDNLLNGTTKHNMQPQKQVLVR